MKLADILKVFLAAACLIGALSLGGCSDSDTVFPGDENGQTEGGDGWEDPEIPADEGDPGDDELITNSQAVDYPNMVAISFKEGSVQVSNPFDGDGVTVTADGAHLTVASTRTDIELAYVLSGVTTDGSVKFYGSYKFNLVFNGVGITNPQGAAVNVQCGKKISVILQDGTANRLIDGETYVHTDNEDMKGTFFSEGQLVFDGSGTLELRGKNKHGICSDDYIRVNSGVIWVKEAASDAIHSNDRIEINGGTITTRSEGGRAGMREGLREDQ